MYSPWLRLAGWHKFNRYNRVPVHRIAYWEVGVMEMGRLDLLLDGRPVVLRAGEFLTIAPGTEIQSRSGANTGMVYWLMVDKTWRDPKPCPAGWRGEWQRLHRALALDVGTPRQTPAPLRAAVERLLTSLADRRGRLVVEAGCLEVVGEIIDAIERHRPEQTGGDLLIQPALTEMAQQVGSRLTLRHLARVCHMSLTTFHSEFRRVTGVSPRHYINELKVLRAQELLRSGRSAARVAQVAAELGFSSPAYFAVVFRKFTGMSPLQYAMSMDQAERRRG